MATVDESEYFPRLEWKLRASFHCFSYNDRAEPSQWRLVRDQMGNDKHRTVAIKGELQQPDLKSTDQHEQKTKQVISPALIISIDQHDPDGIDLLFLFSCCIAAMYFGGVGIYRIVNIGAWLSGWSLIALGLLCWYRSNVL
jgi:hypothetical protein